MSPLEDRLTMTLKEDQDFQRELRTLLLARGYVEAEAKAAVELLLRGVRRGPVESGLGTRPER